MTGTAAYLLLPSVWAVRNRAHRRKRGDGLRTVIFGAIGLLVAAALFAGSFWVTLQLTGFAELGDYLLRLGLSWLFLTFLSFLAFSGVVTALSTFFLADDLRLLFASPVDPRHVFYARFARTVTHASWMIVIFIAPLLLGVGVARCAPAAYYLTAALTVLPFVVIPVAIGTAVTLLLVNAFPARRARDLLVFMGLLFAASLVLLLRIVEPERLMSVESLPDVTDFFATLQSPVTPLLPSFWAGETIFASLQGGHDPLHAAALWTTALALTIAVRMAYERWHFDGYSKAQESPKSRVFRFGAVDRLGARLPLSPVRRHLLVKDLKVFLRDISQWSQLLILLALVALYLINFRALDLDRVPSMSGLIKSAFAFLNLGLAGFVMATVAVRFVFPAVSLEGAAFWIVRTAPIPIGDFLWSKFWTGLVPILVLTETLTVSANYLLGIDPLLSLLTGAAVIFMSLALVGLATGLGARYPRFDADNVTQVAGSYGGITFMIAAVLYIVATMALLGWPSSAYMWARLHGMPIGAVQQLSIAGGFLAFAGISVAMWRLSMRSGVRALGRMDG